MVRMGIGTWFCAGEAVILFGVIGCEYILLSNIILKKSVYSKALFMLSGLNLSTISIVSSQVFPVMRLPFSTFLKETDLHESGIYQPFNHIDSNNIN